jgi:hypothetical protein
MVFEDSAQAAFLDWYDRHMAERFATKVARDRADHGFMSKGPGLVLRLAIVIHLFRWTCGEFDSAYPRPRGLPAPVRADPVRLEGGERPLLVRRARPGRYLVL